MFQLKPQKDSIHCLWCTHQISQYQTIFQGIHTLAKFTCNSCKRQVAQDVPVSHAALYPFAVNLNTFDITGPNPNPRSWFGEPLMQSLKKPQSDQIKLEIIKEKPVKNIIFLNCLDYLYGHALLKLLNAQKHLRENKKKDLVVLIQPNLKWLVPEGVAETWVADLPYSQAQNYYKKLDQNIHQELKRFNEITLSPASPHPHPVNITQFTGVKPHDFKQKEFRISYIWREDRPWFFQFHTSVALRKLNLLQPLLFWQHYKIINLFSQIKKHVPTAQFTIVGLGESFNFPKWIDDQRVTSFKPIIEKKLCQIYAESRLVIGVHGSNMLLPSAHAGMGINLLPTDRIGNIAQDIIYPPPNAESDPRLLAFRFRYLPIDTRLSILTRHAVSMIDKYHSAKNHYVAQ